MLKTTTAVLPLAQRPILRARPHGLAIDDEFPRIAVKLDARRAVFQMLGESVDP
jgi:hypothetical protein